MAEQNTGPAEQTEQNTGPLVDPAEVPDWIRPLVQRTEGLDPSEFGWSGSRPSDDARHAAVLILFGEGSAGPDVLLLRRADSLNSHPGQVAFPGGALDADDRGPVEAALREAEEEVGVLSDGIRPVATLPELHLAFSNFRVIPVLAHWQKPSPVEAVDPAETSAVARVPVSWLTDPANRLNIDFGSGTTGPAFLAPGMLVWGFTGGLLSVLLDLAGWSQDWDTEAVRSLDEAWREAAASTGRGQG